MSKRRPRNAPRGDRDAQPRDREAERRDREAERRDRDAQPRARDTRPRAGDRPPGDPGVAPRDRRGGGVARDLLILVAAFGVGVGAAELLGAANLGVAFGVGQVVFAIVLVVLLTRD